ncbi:MAG: hypothetical protein WD969_08550 [Paracoccaceae bacterium]
MTEAALRVAIAEELAASVIEAATVFAAALAARPGVAAVLFYGSCLQKSTADGLLDFYVLTDARRPFGQGALEAAAGRALPPNVYHETLGTLRAKVAVIDIAAFAARMRAANMDTSIWARFCQRAALPFALDEAAREAVVGAVASAVETGAIWAERLAGGRAARPSAGAAWRTLFAATYGAELRPETEGRADAIVAMDEERFAKLWDLTATARAGAPEVDTGREWARRRRRGKVRNAARLVKAAFTFRGGLDYALWKVERHSGRPVEISPWERRWPWLAAPCVAYRLWRERRLR